MATASRQQRPQALPASPPRLSLFGYAGFLFSYATSFIRLGATRPIELSDFGELDEVDKSPRLLAAFERELERELLRVRTRLGRPDERRQSDVKHASMLRVIYRAFGLWYHVFAMVMMFAGVVMTFVAPITLGVFLKLADEPDSDPVVLWLLAGLVFVSTALNNTCRQQHHHWAIRTGNWARIAVMAAVQKKALRIPAGASHDTGGADAVRNVTDPDTSTPTSIADGESEGDSTAQRDVDEKDTATKATGTTASDSSKKPAEKQAEKSGVHGTILNLQATDGMRLAHGIFFFSAYFWASPIEFVVAFALLYRAVGKAAFVGAASMISVVLLQVPIGRFMQKSTARAVAVSDSRLRRVKELFQIIRMVKTNGWESTFTQRVSEDRERELAATRVVALFQAASGLTVDGCAIVAAMTTFASYTLWAEYPLTAARAFEALVLLGNLRTPLFSVPFLVGSVTGTAVSLTRLRDFLAMPELEEYVAREEVDVTALPATEAGAAIVVKNATFWHSMEARDRAALAGDDGPAARRDTGPGKAESRGSTTIDHHAVRTSSAPAAAAGEASARNLLSVPAAVAGAGNDKGAADDVRSASTAIDAPSAALRGVSLCLPRGSLTAVVGPVGSGKTSLLNSLLGELAISSGSVTLRTSRTAGSSAAESVPTPVSYCAQEPWVANATVRENVVFGHEYAKARFQDVVSRCALGDDLKQLANGDMTSIGERGVTLSGGQQARVAIARALYAKNELCLLDDVLSAVDAHVGRHLWDKVIREGLAGCTRVVVMHQLQYASGAEHVIVMSEGRIAAQGTMPELMALSRGSGAPWAVWLQRSMHQQRKRVANESKEHPRRAGDGDGDARFGGDGADAGTSSHDDAGTSAGAGSASGSASGDGSTSLEAITLDTTAAAASPPTGSATTVKRSGSDSDGDDVMEEEERELGAVSWNVYKAYIRAAGIPWWIGIVVFVTCMSGANVLKDWWLSVWSSEVEGPESKGPQFYLNWFRLFGCIAFGGLLLYQVCWAFAGVSAGQRLHDSMLHNIVRAPKHFYDTTPLGRLTNRFTTDMSMIDKDLPAAFNKWLLMLFACGAAVAVQVVVVPWVIVGVVPLVVLLVLVQNWFRRTSREVKRLDAIAQSPVAAHYTEMLAGLPSIRSYRVQDRLQRHLHQKLDDYNRVYWTSQIINRWLGVRLDLMGALLVGVSSTVSASSIGSVSSGLIGLIMTQSVIIANFLNWVVRSFIDTEAAMNSVERVRHYSIVPTEAPLMVPGNRPERGWPHHGEIVFTDVTASHRPGMAPAIKGVSFRVGAGEKVGICGRTGSGKSTTVACLFRLLELSGGKIEIDGVDISTIGLHDLRSRLSLIAQDPVLVAGTVRFNLDPVGLYAGDDAPLWAALEKSQLRSWVSGLKAGLDHMVDESGSNISQGQKQLLCFARAMLRDTKVYVLDEATGSVDTRTDALLQRTIRSTLADTTQLIVAHRIRTIMHCDKILVLDAGGVAEFGSPEELLARGGIFASLVSESDKQAPPTKAAAASAGGPAV